MFCLLICFHRCQSYGHSRSHRWDLFGARLPTGASGDNVIGECFRPGEEPLFGIMFDGGFAMGADLPLFDEVPRSQRQVTTSTGETATVGEKATFGTLSSGGLY